MIYKKFCFAFSTFILLTQVTFANEERLLQQIEGHVAMMSCPVAGKAQKLSCSSFETCKQTVNTYKECLTSSVPMISDQTYKNYKYTLGMIKAYESYLTFTKLLNEDLANQREVNIALEKFAVVTVNKNIQGLQDASCDPLDHLRDTWDVRCASTAKHPVNECLNTLISFANKKGNCLADPNFDIVQDIGNVFKFLVLSDAKMVADRQEFRKKLIIEQVGYLKGLLAVEAAN